MSEARREFVADELWLFVAILTLPALILASFTGIPFAPEAVVVVGWLLITPVFLFWGEEIATAIYGKEPEDDETSGEQDPLDILKARYARGEIDEAEFEARLDRLLEVDASQERGGEATLERE